MPRPKAHSPQSIAAAALPCFWQRGYAATSMPELLAATGASRQAFYAAYDGKRALYLACFEVYSSEVVTPAFAQVEEPGAGLAEIRDYFEHQIARAEATGLPGPGCLIANAAAEAAPDDREIAARVGAHTARLTRGFQNALGELGPARAEVATALTVFATGLWTASRAVTSAAPLRRAVTGTLHLIEERLSK